MGLCSIDVFISYRRSDAEAFAYLLYTDLSKKGYSVFYDHDSLGAGDFRQAIKTQLSDCRDVVILLSKDALSDRINEPNDFIHAELSEAIAQNKNIVGIFLPGFEGFPDNLPSDIAKLASYNCLYAQMEYYEAMLERLTSGKFLQSSPRTRQNISRPEPVSGKQESLDWFKELPSQERRDYMRLVLDLAKDFNSDNARMRLYNYIDICNRVKGVSEPPEYKGILPTDIVTYLNFFENLYLLLTTDVIDLPIIDDTYRFRFFAGCNNEMVQNSELLELGYQYPNIIDLYDIWRAYLCKENASDIPIDSISNVIVSFDKDLHIRRHEFALARNLNELQSIIYINRYFRQKELTLRKLEAQDLDIAYELHNRVISNIPDNDTLNVFEQLSIHEMKYSLENDVCIGYFDGSHLVGQLNFIVNPTPEQSLIEDVCENVDLATQTASVIDSIVVEESYRGFGLQRSMISIARFLGKRFGSKAIIAVVSPENPVSAKNFIKCGFRVLMRKPKYSSMRDYYYYSLDSTQL